MTRRLFPGNTLGNRAAGVAILLFLTATPIFSATFDEQRKAVAASVETQSEGAIISLLKSGIDEGKPTQAIAEARKWLRQNLPDDAMLLFYAGRAAELSGDANGSAALYQQYLKKADPKAETTGQAVIAVHVLLRDQLKDVSAAYSFNKNDGNRLAANPTLRQFDQWFLNEAMKRKDSIAVANRLHALLEAGISEDLLTTFYDSYFRWLLEEENVYVEQRGIVPSTDELVAAYKQLSAAMTFNEELALRLDWAASVRAYNQAKIAEEDVAPPIAEAKALLEKYPRYARWVQTGWAGGGTGRHYRNDPKKYWPHEIEAKMAPIVAAATKLTPLQLADLMESWREDYYDDRVVSPLTVKVVSDYLTANPKLMNRRNGILLLEKEWNKFTPEEAKALAPQIADNSQPEVSAIHAIAAGGEEKDLNKMIAALVGQEAWRLGIAELDGRYADALWHYAGRPGDSANRDQKIKESKAVAAEIKAAALDLKAAPAQRLGLFKKLWADYKSNQPKIPGVVDRLKAIVRITPEAIPDLLKDQSAEAQMLARNAIEQGITGSDPIWQELEAADKVSVTSFDPEINHYARQHAGGRIEELKKRHPQKCVAHPLEPALQKAVQDGLKKKDLAAWELLAWINMQYPENNEEQVKLAQALTKSPLWQSMPHEVHFAVREWFGKAVMNPEQIAWVDAADHTLVCKELLALVEQEDKTKEAKTKDAEELDEAARAAIAAKDVKAAVAALQATVESIGKSPVRIEVPERALENLASLDPAVFADATAQELILKLIDQLKVAQPTNDFAYQILGVVAKNGEPLVLHRIAPFLWEGVNRNHRIFSAVKELTLSLIDEIPSAASAFASAGLDAIARHKGHTYYKRETDIPLFKATIGNAAMQMGLIVIPVAKNHPAYPVYESQGDWITGNEDSAWTLLDKNWEPFLSVHRELSIPYLLWTLQRTIYSRDETRQETLVKALLAWAEEAGSPLDPAEKAQIEIAYGDIAMQRGQLGQAYEIYSRTQQKEAYQELPIRHTAALRRVTAERVARNFDGALKTLAELEFQRIPEIWEEIRYARALVHFDMEEFEDAKDDIDSILARNSNQSDAKILLGKVQLKRQKLMEATEVELGSSAAQKSLVPGERLKVTLVDPTLAVSGAGTEIEVVVWATSGDKETFFLRQFGDSKTKFRGEAETALGAPTPGDDILQVIGDDEVYYAYSKRFREKMNNLEEKRGGPIVVASDAVLMASARKLLTEAEQRTADMEAMMDSIKGTTEGAAKAAMAARSMSAEARAEEDGFSVSEFERFSSNVAKPGNPVHVRVIDPDRSRTAEIDELKISVATSSGDSISQVTLKETGTHSGWFEGSIPTTGAQALAFSRNSEPGRNPNMVISPQADSYPAWRPLADANVKPDFTVDLNDNVAIEELTVVSKEAGSSLKSFYIQTGMNDTEMRTVATFPRNLVVAEHPWEPSVVVMNDTDETHTNAQKRKLVDEFGDVVRHFDSGWMTQRYHQGFATNVSGISGALPTETMEKVDWKRQDRHAVSSVIYRFQGHFYEKADVTRRFRLDLGGFDIPKDTHPSINHKPQFLLAVDGRPITGANGRLDGSISLKAGLHTFEIWASGWVANIGFGKRGVKLQANLENPEQLVEVPDDFFDPTSFPEDVLGHRNAPAETTANGDGTEFTVKFAPESRARLIKLVMLDQEGAVPALNKLILKGPEGEGILPVAEDFASLNKNETLEILTGDKIAVRYIDDRFVTKSKERHERSLEVAFTDARTEFADMEPRYSIGHGKDMPYYERLLRFPYDESLSLAIHDADMDVSIEPDKISVTLKTEAGEEREYQATETGDSTGIFKLIVIPVKGDASGADRIKVDEGGTITAIYRDRENNRPGVPTDRIAKINHAEFTPPKFNLSHATVTPLETGTTTALTHGFERRDYSDPDREKLANERVSPRWKIENALLPAVEAPQGGFNVVHGRTAYLELIAPHLALGTSSSVAVYVQTDSGRKRAGAGSGGFDITVPGTVALSATTGRGFGPKLGHGNPWNDVPSLEIYQGGEIPSSSAPEFDRFKLTVPLIAGMPQLQGALTYDERKELAEDAKTSRAAAAAIDQMERISGLVVQPGEDIHFGFQYKDKEGKQQWLTASAKVVTHPAFDIMSEDYREPMTSAYVGESLNLRVVDLGADTSNDSDKVSVLVQGKSGSKHLVELTESGPHTGIFKADPILAYAETKEKEPTPEGGEEAEYDVRALGFPVTYGDTVAARYTDGNGVKTDVEMVTISKGADGSIQPFSKVYDDVEIATRTQFSLAEAYLEMAKRHRKLGQTEAAAIEYASAKQLLSKAMDEFTDPETRAHAEYLLGTLTMEEADATEEAEMQEIRYRASLSRFLSVTGSYPQTIHASKAQYQIATLYERLKEPEIAAQEYVKLAYKFPDSEYLATSMARLGSHFLKKAAMYEAKAKPLLQQIDDKDAQFEGAALQKMAVSEYIKTAQIFGRLQERFPSDSLAGQAGLRAGQSFMRAGKKQEAIDSFQRVINEESYDGPDIRAQAIYWMGMCYQDLRQQMAAYATFKRLTYDFPESKWAAYARAQLSQESLLKLETNLELQRLEGEQ